MPIVDPRTLVCTLALVAIAAAAPGCAEVEPDEVTESSGAALSGNKQPKLEMLLSGDSAVPITPSVCTTSALIVKPTLRGETLMNNVAEFVFSPAEGRGFEAVIHRAELDNFISGEQKSGPIFFSNLLSLEPYEGSRSSLQIIQRRRNGKIVGRSNVIEFFVSDPRFDLFGVQPSATCGADEECFVVNARMFPSDDQISDATYSCVDSRLMLMLQDDAGTSVRLGFSEKVFRGGGNESHVTYANTHANGFHATKAAIARDLSPISRWVDIQR